MKNYLTIIIVFLLLTTCNLVLGWIPQLGVIIPQIVFLGLTLVLCPNVMTCKAACWFYLFFIVRLFTLLLNGGNIDIAEQISNFLRMSLPLYISSYLFSRNDVWEISRISKFALALTFITVVLSLRILISDGSALRVTSCANSTGDFDMCYHYWRMGIAEYSMAAMMMFMPAVLVYLLKQNNTRGAKFIIISGIILSLLFLYLGQVTAPFIIGIVLLFFVLFENFNKRNIVLPAILIMLIGVFFLESLLNILISATSDSAMNEKFIAISSYSNGEGIDESSDVGIRLSLLGGTINTFFSHPLFGDINGQYGGHNYFLDMLAKFGLIGSLPFFMMIFSQCKMIMHAIPNKAKQMFTLIIIGFVAHGLIKNMSGFDYWTYLFIYYPSILTWGTLCISEKEQSNS